MKNKGYTILGKGIYTVSEAARLARISSARLTRWVAGCERLGVSYPPLWQSDLAPSEDGTVSVVSFSDLMEVMVISAFYSHGVQIQTVRKAIGIAADRFGIEKPFSSERFQTDGKRVFVDLKDFDASDNGLMDIVSSQRAFREIVQPTFRNIDFQDYTAVRWWPLGKKKSVVVDPSRSLGAPISADSGVPVEALINALGIVDKQAPTISEITSVARMFAVPAIEVRDAAVFESKYAA